ncbi:MAG: hypothetical protein NC299_08760 [Lachnospiraceae bacterium]|nr:hypothetical protein [Lachnospiraceae bacterium]
MADDFVNEGLCRERCMRLEEEDKRQNHRIDKLEETVEKIHELAAATNKLASSMEDMLEEQKMQGQRLSDLEKKDGKKWARLVELFVAAGGGALVTALVQMFLRMLGG